MIYFALGWFGFVHNGTPLNTFCPWLSGNPWLRKEGTPQ